MIEELVARILNEIADIAKTQTALALHIQILYWAIIAVVMVGTNLFTALFVMMHSRRKEGK